MNTSVTDLRFTSHDGKSRVDRIAINRAGVAAEIVVSSPDYVLVTLGSMTEASTP
jgi:myosin-crossreactive antigen